jgi:hypothetical protein
MATRRRRAKPLILTRGQEEVVVNGMEELLKQLASNFTDFIREHGPRWTEMHRELGINTTALEALRSRFDALNGEFVPRREHESIWREETARNELVAGTLTEMRFDVDWLKKTMPRTVPIPPYFMYLTIAAAAAAIVIDHLWRFYLLIRGVHP